MFPLVSYPNPQPRPEQGEEGHNDWSSIVEVQRDWSIEELNEVAKDLPDHRKNSKQFVTDVDQMVKMYKPSAAEIAQVLRRKLRLDWQTVSGDFKTDLTYSPDGPFAGQLKDLMTRITEKWPVLADWTFIHNCKQGSEESWDDYYARLLKCYRDHSGLDPGTDTANEMLKNVIMNGIRTELKQAVIQSCIGWQTGSLDELMRHIVHHSRDQDEQKVKKKEDKEKKQIKLQTVQLQYYQNQTPGGDRGGGRRGLGRGRGGEWSSREDWRLAQGQTPDRGRGHMDRPFLFKGRCDRCGRYGHKKGDCPDEGWDPKWNSGKDSGSQNEGQNMWSVGPK
ncbi:hypothetical protein HHUSO_G32897 [Huso huso]|uniref:CCHC-type domain-containing protein n=1 Tax=Huso huso TaxID=61971 RepID=A0ABR0Y8G8_HUSHU